MTDAFIFKLPCLLDRFPGASVISSGDSKSIPCSEMGSPTRAYTELSEKRMPMGEPHIRIAYRLQEAAISAQGSQGLDLI